MTDRWGIDEQYVDANGELRSIAPATIAAFREIIGEPDARPSPQIVRPADRPDLGRGELTLEDGAVIEVQGPLPPALPFGYHSLRTDGGEVPVISSPGRCHLPAERRWGWAVQLYAARSRRSWGIGDHGDLKAIADRGAADRAGFLLVNPLLATAPVAPIQPSPYSPTSRCFHNVLHLDVESVPGASEVVEEWAPFAAAARALNDRRRIDRDEVWRLKSAALHRVWQHVRDRDDRFRSWRQQQPSSLDDFTTWCVLAERHGSDYRFWPSELRRPDSAAVQEVRRAGADRASFHAWLQWCCAQQLDAVAGRLALVQDLPVGFDPGGADAWRWKRLLADGVSIGAPPDQFNADGQDWGLPPFVPWRLRTESYDPFVETVRASMSNGGGLRIDHVMGLFRQWWVPRDGGPADGAYVRFPADDLLAIVALESVRAAAVVVGEDLGTVEEGVRETMADHGMLSYRLLWFEDAEPQEWPTLSMAAVTTHDLPTVAGLWTGRDLQAQRDAGVTPNEADTQAIRKRLASAASIGEDDDLVDVVERTYELLGRAPSLLLTAALDDAVLEPERPNIPGADEHRPNWSLALPLPVEDVLDAPAARRIAAHLRAAVAQEP
jgi:4-alpha-glucanotransferase